MAKEITAITPRLLSVEEAARLLGISRGFMYRLVSAGHVRTVRVGDLRKVPAEEIDRIAREGVPSPSHRG